MKVKATIVEISSQSTSTFPTKYRLTLIAIGSKEECDKLAKEIFKR